MLNEAENVCVQMYTNRKLSKKFLSNSMFILSATESFNDPFDGCNISEGLLYQILPDGNNTIMLGKERRAVNVMLDDICNGHNKSPHHYRKNSIINIFD